MRVLVRRPLDDGRHALVAMTEVADGDRAVGATRPAGDPPWVDLVQTHGRRTTIVEEPPSGPVADCDASVTGRSGIVLAVRVADCVPIGLLGTRAIGLVHAGWRGVEAGVIEAAVEALGQVSPGAVRAVIGPCIHVECYEFGEPGRQRLARQLGAHVLGETSDGRPALDMVAAARSVLDDQGVTVDQVDSACTACDPRYWSHRATQALERQAMIGWIEP